MSKIKSFLAAIVLIATGLTAYTPANAQFNVFTDHTIVSDGGGGVNRNIDVPFPTGNYPYIGRIGIEYKYKNIGFQAGYIHRSNVDLNGDEYNYDRGFVGIRYEYCVFGC